MKNTLLIVFLISLFHSLGIQAQEINVNKNLMWVHQEEEEPDRHIAFRGKFNLEEETKIDLQISGASWYVVWIDGKQFTEGPDRYAVQYPEFQRRTLTLSEGEHLVAVQVHYQGIETRLQKIVQPFLYLKAFSGKNEIPINWKAGYLNGYISQGRRINSLLGWIEWADLRFVQNKWQQHDYDDSEWGRPVFVKGKLELLQLQNFHL